MKIFGYKLEKEVKTQEENEKGLISHLFDKTTSLSNNIIEGVSEKAKSLKDFSKEEYNGALDFLSEKSFDIGNFSKDSFVSIKTKIGDTFENIEFKDNFFVLISKLDIPFVIQNLSQVKVNDQKAKHALKVVITLLQVIDKHKSKKLAIANSNLTNDSELSIEVVKLLKDINMKDVLEAVKPYIGMLPFPIGQILYLIIEIFI